MIAGTTQAVATIALIEFELGDELPAIVRMEEELEQNTELSEADAAEGSAKRETTVLGKYPDYVNLASELKANRFNIPENIWNSMTSTEQWEANAIFLDRAIARGDRIVLSNRVTDINKVKRAFREELDYLIGKGYKLSSNGLQMIK